MPDAELLRPTMNCPSADTAQGVRAFIWDETDGMRRVDTELLLRGVIVPLGWVLNQASGVSADGTVIAGWGVNPAGQSEAWIAVIPEPASALLLGFGVTALGAISGRAGRRSASRLPGLARAAQGGILPPYES